MVRIIGHRGASKLWPENSLGGFEEALKLPIDGIEFDVHRTADGELVVLHDAKIDRTARGTGIISAMTIAQVKTAVLKSGQGGTIPTLVEVLDLFRMSDKEMQIEIKTDIFGRPYPGMPSQIMEAVRKFHLQDRCTLTSFVPTILLEAHHDFPDVRYLASINAASAQQMGGIAMAMGRFGAIPECVMAIHKDILVVMLESCIDLVGSSRLGAWVPNTHEELSYWMRAPILQVTTDSPDVALLYQ
jgi:glycerophosphoryl diester phosphodiesterase